MDAACLVSLCCHCCVYAMIKARGGAGGGQLHLSFDYNAMFCLYVAADSVSSFVSDDACQLLGHFIIQFTRPLPFINDRRCNVYTVGLLTVYLIAARQLTIPLLFPTSVSSTCCFRRLRLPHPMFVATSL